MYQIEDLESLAGDDAAYLKDIVCDLAMFRLIKRRPERFSDASKAIADWAHKQLRLIREGYAVFPIDANIEAGQDKLFLFMLLIEPLLFITYILSLSEFLRNPPISLTYSLIDISLL